MHFLTDFYGIAKLHVASLLMRVQQSERSSKSVLRVYGILASARFVELVGVLLCQQSLIVPWII